ncbi:hypothetical protein ACLOAU_21845 [Niabella sp. CJ426]|uniref:hypothetical protein n=1 Tax=Niabella sp. CJ426 TaxID=3393740 RepID=UPI003D05A15A
MKRIYLSFLLSAVFLSTQAQDRIYMSAACPTFTRMAASAETMAASSTSVANPTGSTTGWFQGSINPTTGVLTPGTNYYNSSSIKGDYPIGISPFGYLYSIAGNVTTNNNGIIQLAYKSAVVFDNAAPALTPAIDLNGTSNPTQDIYPNALGIGSSGNGGLIYEDGSDIKYIGFTTAANGSVTWGSSVMLSLINSDAPAAWNSFIEINDLDFDAAGNLYILGTRFEAGNSAAHPAIYTVPAANVVTGAMTATLKWGITDNKDLTAGGTAIGGNRGLAYAGGTFYLSQSSTSNYTTFTNYITAIHPPASGNTILLDDNYTTLTGYCEIGDIAALSQSTLPVEFGSLSATIQNDQLNVQWQTLAEVNNDHFEVEASNDGVHFTGIAKVASKATKGNHEGVLNYSFSIDINGLVFGVGAIAFSMLFVRRRKSLIALSVVLALITIVQIGCSKNNHEVSAKDSNLFIRIAQLDKDGKKTYSRIIQVIK